MDCHLSSTTKVKCKEKHDGYRSHTARRKQIHQNDLNEWDGSVVPIAQGYNFEI